MRRKLLKLAMILLLAGSVHGRPQQSELSETFEPDLEIHDEEGWIPVANGRNFPQEQTPVDKDLPEIVEGNSRYKEDRRTTHKKFRDFFRGEIIGDRTNWKRLESSDTNQLQDDDEKDFARVGNTGQYASVNSNSSSDFAKMLAKLKKLANVTSATSSSALGNSRIESAIKLRNFVKIIPQSTINPSSILNGYRPDLETEKVGEPIMIQRVEYNNASNSDSHSTIALKNDIRDPVAKSDLHLFKSKTNAFENASNKSVVVFTNRDNESFGKRSTKSTVKIKPEIYVPLNDVTSENNMNSDIFVKINSIVKNGAKQKISTKPNSELGAFYSNLKTRPYNGLQNTEGFSKYEKYTLWHENDENLDKYQFATDSVYYENVPIIPNIGAKPNVHKKQKPPILVFENSLPPKYPTVNNDRNVITIYDPEPFVEPNANDDRDTGNWQQIPDFTSNQSHLPVANKNQTQLDDFASILANLHPNDPTTTELENVVTDQQNNHDEVLHDEGQYTNQVVAQDNHYEPIFENSYSEVFSEVAAGESDSNAEVGNDATQILVQDEEFQGPKKPQYNSTSVVSQNTVVHIINKGDGKPNITVAEMKIPDIQDNSMNMTSLSHGPHHPANSSAYTPNVHVMFMTQQAGLEDNGLQQPIPQQKVPEVTYSQGTDCPTITINSYTTINNTLESKEGCTDLNIIINSHVVNTNLFQAATGNLETENVIENDRKPGNSESPEANGLKEVYGTSDPGYSTSNEGYEIYSGVHGSPGSTYGSYADPLESVQSVGATPLQSDTQDYSIPNANDQDALQDKVGPFDQPYPSSSFIQVLQETEINLISQNDSPDPGEQFNTLPLQDEQPATDFQNDPLIPVDGDANALAVSGGDIESNSAADVANDAPVLDDGGQSDLITDSVASDTPVVSQEMENDPLSSGVLGDPGIQSDPATQEGTPAVGIPPVTGLPGIGGAAMTENDSGVLADPGIQSDPATQGGTPPAGGIPSLPSLGGIGDSMADTGFAGVAADTPLSAGTSGLQLPIFSNPLSAVSGQLPSFPGISGAQGASGGFPSTAGAPSSVLDDEEEDEDDEGDFGLMSSGFIDTMTSYFPYLTFLSPLNLGFFSFAITPFAVAAAGISGFAALVSPWAFPILDFGRAADRVTIKLKSNIEEDVKQSIHKYENWNDWKSRRKKREI